ncbi:hypothetical protein A3E39_01415 [Candidatus Uhrbacteria bacterium RIFCSPHIGHO2_12_FULL_60_25]|uniref:HMA domain-containing protein n=1 Tax=Candidatus Uhrbacteria bacterium RIFCSPHIGHO2_12_FULL_60_25 TaxID=1802399 RepID=A0A1F7UKJ5_9BACT|nr:MAG: hypothetical protein A3D73_03435 [Candidatus Uhrbacteria bacterium RIFCSPHIGHO2_02_FULL_60_44]OGL78802.1 MAG: hypothetical protein A3E39_01415 [Candidatus Uhrbacteria bacterium RIFCSPHIGHO2_12_FULL_60_25]
MNVQHFTITNLTCSACAKVCSLILKKIEGVHSVTIDDATGHTTVVADRPIEPSHFRDELALEGYQVG